MEVSIMANVTLSIDDELLKAGKEYSRKNLGCSLNELIRELLKKTVSPESTGWVEEVFKLADESGGNSGGKTWTREELHERQDIS
jgi:hypothetical protein